MRAALTWALQSSEILACGASARLDRQKPRLKQAHIGNHAAYRKSWLKVVADDAKAIFSTAKDAEAMASYMLGLERQRTTMDPHKELVEEYERSMG